MDRLVVYRSKSMWTKDPNSFAENVYGFLYVLSRDPKSSLLIRTAYQCDLQYIYDTQFLHRTRIVSLTINRSGWGIRLNSVDLGTYMKFFSK